MRCWRPVSTWRAAAARTRSCSARPRAGPGWFPTRRTAISPTQAEPGLFRTAFSVPENLEGAADPAKAGHSGLTPFQLLAAALDELVDAGVLPRRRRPGAQFLAWSAVHGLAMLVIDGPLRGLPPRQTEDITHRLLDMVDQGLEEDGGMTA